MKVLYDYQAFTFQYFGGVSKCFCELIKNRPVEEQYEISLKYSNNTHLLSSCLKVSVEKPIIDELMLEKLRIKGRRYISNILKHVPFSPMAEAANMKETIKCLKQGNFDIFHPTFFDDYFIPYLNGKPFVITIHDMMPELYNFWKGDLQIKNKKKLCDAASAIIAVSENTKKDLVDMLNIAADKVHVIYHGGPECPSKWGDRILSYRYFLYVGHRNSYKNFQLLISEFSIIKDKYPDVHLVCTGVPFSEDEISIIKKHNLQDRITQVMVSDADLSNLYHYADFFIYPSLYEGFGMPILEAFSNRCPVILSNCSCFPEVAGDAALYFDTDGFSSNIAHVIDKFYNLDGCQVDSLIDKGIQRLDYFNWKRSSKMLYQLYMNVIS